MLHSSPKKAARLCVEYRFMMILTVEFIARNTSFQDDKRLSKNIRTLLLKLLGGILGSRRR